MEVVAVVTVLIVSVVEELGYNPTIEYLKSLSWDELKIRFQSLSKCNVSTPSASNVMQMNSTEVDSVLFPAASVVPASLTAVSRGLFD